MQLEKVNAEDAGNWHKYRSVRKKLWEVNKKQVQMYLDILEKELAQSLAELRSINVVNEPERFKKALEAYNEKQRETIKTKQTLIGAQQNFDAGTSQEVSRRVRQGFAQVEYSIKQGSGSFNAFEAMNAGRQSVQEAALAIAKQQTRYLRDIKENTSQEKEATFA